MAPATAYTSSTHCVTMDDGVGLHVRILGENIASTPLLISLHGAPGISTYREPEASFHALSDRFRVLVYDARGSGESDHRGPYSHDRWIRDIETLREWAGAETFVLAGASYGSFVALDYAIKHGDRLSGLVLRAPWVNGRIGSMRAMANALRSPNVSPDIEKQVRLWSGTIRDDQDLADALQEIFPFYLPPEDKRIPVLAEEPQESTEFQGSVRFYAATANYAFSVNMPAFDVSEGLRHIKAPTLVAVGRYDYVCPVPESERIAKEIPNATLEIFEHSGHSPPSDEPQAFEEKLSAWLRTTGLVPNNGA